MKFLSMILILSAAIAAQAGTEGHGGGAMVCRDAQGKIASAELMDFFEAREVNKPQLTIIKDNTPGTRLKQAQAALARLQGYGFKLDQVVASERVLNEKLELTQVDDSKHPAVERGCKYEQLANYTDDGEILIDGEIFPYLSETDKAGLDVHETIYLFLREWMGPELPPAVEDSRSARRATAAVFSTSEVRPFNQMPDDSWVCIPEYDPSGKVLDAKNYGPKVGKEFPDVAVSIFDSGKVNDAGWSILTVSLFGIEHRPQLALETFEIPAYMFSNDPEVRLNVAQDVLKVHTISDVDSGQELEIRTTPRKLKEVMFEVFVPKLRKSTMLKCEPGFRVPKGQKPSIDPDKITLKNRRV